MPDSFEKYAKDFSQLSLGLGAVTPAFLSSVKVLDEYLAMGYGEDTARKFYEAGITAEMLHGLMPILNRAGDELEALFKEFDALNKIPNPKRPKRKLTVEKLLNG